MSKSMEQIRNSIIKSKQSPLLWTLRKDFYLACVSHFIIIFLTVMTLGGFTAYLTYIPEIQPNYILFIEPISLLISAIILILISSTNGQGFFTKHQNVYSYVFIIFCGISVWFLFLNTLIGIIILNILSKIWSSGDMGEKNNLYVSFLFFIPLVLLFLTEPWPYPLIGFLIYLVIMLIVKIIVFVKKYKQVLDLDRQHLNTVLSIK